jgi:2-iminoacetate synthase ThiH
MSVVNIIDDDKLYYDDLISLFLGYLDKDLLSLEKFVSNINKSGKETIFVTNDEIQLTKICRILQNLKIHYEIKEI